MTGLRGSGGWHRLCPENLLGTTMRIKLYNRHILFFALASLGFIVIVMTADVRFAYAQGLRAEELQENPLDILDIQPGATKEEITKAYRRLALKHHPDQNGGTRESYGEFFKVQQAYEFLKRRNFKTFDLTRTSPAEKQRSPQEIRNVFFDVLSESLFDETNMESKVKSAFQTLEELKRLDHSLYTETFKEGVGIIETKAVRTSDWLEEQRLYALLYSLQLGCADFLRD